MSNVLSTACRPIQTTPTAKSVLMAMADFADDGGRCWPSIPKLCEYTCFSRRAVIDAIAVLESIGVIVADRSNGRHTSYFVRPHMNVKPVQLPHQCSSRTRAANDQTSAAPALDQCSSRTGPVQLPHPNHQEPSRTVRATTNKSTPANPEGVSPQTWMDWLHLRKAKKAPVTLTVLDNAKAEAVKADMTLDAFLRIWCARGSQGLQAEWLKPNERSTANAKPSASANFRGTDYGTTDIDSLPADMRDAVRAELAMGG